MPLKHQVRGPGEIAAVSAGSVELVLSAEPCSLSENGLSITVTGTPPGTPVELSDGWCVVHLPGGPVAFTAWKPRDVAYTKPYCIIDAPPAWRITWNAPKTQPQEAGR